MIDPLWLLLLPLAAMSGWLAADRNRNWWGGKKKVDVSQAYLRGLNFLLNEETDKAIEVFIKALEVDSETVEMHMALGNLFRRRGEIERATRIHQNLIARPNLDKSQRQQALFELAQDYFKAGLLDRAEGLLIELNEGGQHNDKVSLTLLQIYEQEKEWEKAIYIAQNMKRSQQANYQEMVSQYYCELAEVVLTSGDYQRAKKYINRALSKHAECVRASIQLGRLETYSGNYKKGIEIWGGIRSSKPEYLSEVVHLIAQNYRKLDDLSGLQEYLNVLAQESKHPKIALVLTDLIMETQGRQKAEKYMVDWVRQNPSVRGLLRLIQLKFETADSSVRSDLDALESLMESILTHSREYECRQCGFGGKVILVAVNGVFGYPAVLTWAAFGMGLRKIFSTPEKARILNGALGLSLIIVAIWVALPH